MQPQLEKAMNSLSWLGHAGYRFEAPEGPVYIDPFSLTRDRNDAWLLLLTHDHHDHYSPEDVGLVKNDRTIIVAPASVADLIGGDKVKVMAPGDELSLGSINIKAVPAYNTNKDFHPKAKNWPGYVFSLEGVTYYHTGDSDFIPEMKAIKTDIALLPVSGTYVMTAGEAAQAALALAPACALPMHYGKIVGSTKDAEDFARQLQGQVEVKILKADG
jgi:L-ascorbate metabolism protein UlaG (beta-lactamase superfamily)